MGGSIEELQVGDQVLSYNLVTGQTEADEIVQLYTTVNANLAVMTFGDSRLQATVDHPFYVKGKGWCSLRPDLTRETISNFSEVGQLEVGDICYLLEGGQLNEVTLTSAEATGTLQRTYTIQRLTRNQTFFAEGILVGAEEVRNQLPRAISNLRLNWAYSRQPIL